MISASKVRVALWTGQCNDLPAIEDGLQRLGCHVMRADSFHDLLSVLRDEKPDLLIVSCFSARDVLRWLHSTPGGLGNAAHVPVLTLASSLDVDLYLEAMQLGAFDCAGLPLDKTELGRLISRAVEAGHLAMHA